MHCDKSGDLTHPFPCWGCVTFAEMARQAGQRSPWGRLYKHIQKTVTAAAKASKAGASSTTSAPTAAAAAGAGASSPDIEQSSGSTKCSSITSAASDVDKLKRQQRGQRFCWCCNAAGAASVKLKVCTGCRNAHYCSVDCQNRVSTTGGGWVCCKWGLHGVARSKYADWKLFVAAATNSLHCACCSEACKWYLHTGRCCATGI